MWQQAFKSFLVTVALVLLIGGPIVFSLKKEPPRPQSASDTEPLDKQKKINQIFEKASHISTLRKKMLDAGWSIETADAVIKLNRQWFLIIAEENELAFSKMTTLLAGLGEYEPLMSFLNKHPETASLFAMVSSPASLLDLFQASPSGYVFLANLYVLHASLVDAESFTDAVKNNADLIASLYQRGIVGCEVIFIFQRDDEGAFEYEQWLRELLLTKMDASDQEMASLVNMLLLYGYEIRQRLRNDFAFRREFRSTIWPKMVRVAQLNNNLLDIYLDDPRVWDLLALAEGEELLKTRGPLLPIDLLFGYPELGRSPYPEDLHNQVIQVLLSGDEQTFRALLNFRDEPLFHSLLRRPVSPRIKAAAFTNLEQASNYHELLKRYDKMTDTGLKAEVGPGPGILKIWTPFYYTFWEVPRKVAQGRDPTGTEWFNSLADPVSFLYPILKVGVAVVNVGKSMAGVKQETPMHDALKKTSLKMAEQQLGKEIAITLSDQELTKFAVTGMLTEMQKVYRKNISRSVLFNTTRPVAFMMSYSGAGQSTMKALKKINGSYLMRGDAKLVVQPNNGAVGVNASKYLFKTSEAFVNTSLKIENTPQNYEKQLTSWRQNVSAWWFLHACDMLH